MHRFFTPRCIGLHLTLLVVLPVFAWLTWWQMERALAGNTLSWAYTFEWPLFAAYACYMWWQLVHDQLAGRTGAAAPTPDDADAAVASGERDGSGPHHRQPGWALTGGRRKNVAIAAAAPIGEHGGRGERFTDQTPEEAAALARYNRYLAGLEAADAAARPAGSGTAGSVDADTAHSDTAGAEAPRR